MKRKQEQTHGPLWNWLHDDLRKDEAKNALKRKKVRKVAMKKKPRKEVCVCSHTKLQHHDCVYTGPEKCPSYCYGCPCQKFRPKRRKK